jgi:C4-dicarboxylate-specific signal transduction histidine kinase
VTCECNLLIVDDVEDNLFLLEDVLEDEFDSMNVFPATSGEAALEIIKNNRIDLAILDIQMPGMNGFELCKRIKSNKETEEMPVIFLTAAYKSKEFIQNGFKNGAVDYIIKPFDVDQLINRLTLYLKIIKQQNQLKGLNCELEEKVALQTAELRDLNGRLEERVQEELHKNKEKDHLIYQQSKLAIMGEMTRMIAHQWRQPLTSLLAIIQSIEFKDRINKLTKDDIKESSVKAKEITQKMSTVIDDFQSFFKPDKQKTEFLVDKTISKTLALMEAEFVSEGIEIEFDIKVTGITIVSYKNEFIQVLLNILKNSVDVLMSKNIQDKKIKISVVLSASEIAISVEDNAGGIPDDIISFIFDPYFSTKSQNGSGMGLFMSKIIIEEHMNGKLIANNSESGAVFSLIFPIGFISTNR